MINKEVIPTSITSQIMKEGIKIGLNNQINKIFKEAISKITIIFIRNKIDSIKEESRLKSIIIKM